MIQFSTQSQKMIGDLTTPVSLFLKLREHFPEVVLLESSDYSSKEDSKSFICFDSIANIQEISGTYVLNDGHSQQILGSTAASAMAKFLQYFTCTDEHETSKFNGVFGYTSFDVVQEFENISFNKDKPHDQIPKLRYDFFGMIIIFDHFYGTLRIIENQVAGKTSVFQKVKNIIDRQDHQSYNFTLEGEEDANMTSEDFIDMVEKAKEHCQRGDVFQMVVSRRFSQGFKGDEFNVYRTLRSINPSPYLFYFDYGSYKIFGSSPEAQLVVHDGIAEIHPIAGTFLRTGDYMTDQELAQNLRADPKENAEHIMLVDLARNDLSKNCHQVHVSKYKDIQFFSHVIHLVSVVKGNLKAGVTAYQLFADTFPAGTLSGAPKHKALTLIDKYEPTARTFYGGGIGMITFDGNLNHAIIIRSFLSNKGRLQYQSGAGIVINSNAQSELQEVKNKLSALRKALTETETI